MNAPSDTPVARRGPGCPRAAQRLYQLLLLAYPQEFRAEYGREMALLFHDLCGEGDVRSVRFWVGILGDVARSAPALRAEAWRGRGMKRTRTVEVLMRFAALLTVLLGLYATLSAVIEGVLGLRGTMSGAYMLAVALGGLAGALLLTAGVTLLRRSPSARTATAAALTSLGLIILVRVVHPWMGIFLQLVGVGLPVTLLIALHWPRRPSASRAA